MTPSPDTLRPRAMSKLADELERLLENEDPLMSVDWLACNGHEVIAHLRAPGEPAGEPVALGEAGMVSVPIKLVEWLKNSVPESEIGDDWTKGYEEAKRRGYRIALSPKALAATGEECTYCKVWYPKPVSHHHDEAECKANQAPTPRTDDVMFVGDAGWLPVSQEEYDRLALHAQTLERELNALSPAPAWVDVKERLIQHLNGQTVPMSAMEGANWAIDRIKNFDPDRAPEQKEQGNG